MSDWFRSVALGSVLVGGLVAAVVFLPGAGPRAATPAGVADDTLGALPADEWLNVDGTAPTAESLKGTVVLVEFWTYLCYNCKNVESWMQDAHRRWGDGGLAVLGIHTPEFDVERNVENVRRYLRDNRITWPVAIDNAFRVWRRYNTTNAWPAFLVFDRDGRLVYRRAGEGAVHGAAEAIEHSLGRPRTSSQAEVPRAAVRVTSTVTRPSADTALLTVTLVPDARTRLVRQPANELHVLMPTGVAGPEGPVLIGEPGTPADAGELVYFDAPASVTVPLAVRGGGPFRIEGRVIYRSCDSDAGTCRRDETTFVATVPGGRESARSSEVHDDRLQLLEAIPFVTVRHDAPEIQDCLRGLCGVTTDGVEWDHHTPGRRQRTAVAGTPLDGDLDWGGMLDRDIRERIAPTVYDADPVGNTLGGDGEVGNGAGSVRPGAARGDESGGGGKAVVDR